MALSSSDQASLHPPLSSVAQDGPLGLNQSLLGLLFSFLDIKLVCDYNKPSLIALILLSINVGKYKAETTT